MLPMTQFFVAEFYNNICRKTKTFESSYIFDNF